MNHHYIIKGLVDESVVIKKAKEPYILHYHRAGEPCNTKCTSEKGKAQ